MFSKIGLIGLALASCLATLGPVQEAFAAAALVGDSRASPQNSRIIGYGDVTAGVTFATTSYADLTGSNITYTPTYNDCTTAARTKACLIVVEWSADATKATSTTGTCAIYVNGAIVASTARTTGLFANAYTIGGVYAVPNTTVGAQTLKLQCKSGDTAVLTVTNAHVIYREVVLNR